METGSKSATELADWRPRNMERRELGESSIEQQPVADMSHVIALGAVLGKGQSSIRGTFKRKKGGAAVQWSICDTVSASNHLVSEDYCNQPDEL
uniref:Uncharacterized protein n=1 Tax=Oryza sativa subsp. japonica TaxID=39947 RepID=Q69SR1_ORYSJ|nr:hypothetical protein [Oryza sativa Japonica Group]